MPEPIPEEALARAVRAAFGPGARIAAAEALFGDASSRRYVRLRLGGERLPAAAIAMLLGEGRFAPGSDELGDGGPVEELPFLNVGRYLAAHRFPIPAVYLDASRTDGLLLVEDVGDVSLWAAASRTPPEAPALFGAAVDLLVALQVAGARAPDPTCYAFRRRLDGRLARAELAHFLDHGIETRHGRPLGAAARAALSAGLEPIAAPFDAAAPVLSHRDFMAWNIHVQDGRLRLIDFQDAFLAPDAYDLASLLTDRTTSAIVGPALEQTLIARFEVGRQSDGLPVPPEFARRYRLCALHRALKVIGRFHYLELVQGKPGYLAYLPAVYGVARRMFALLPELGGVQAEIAPHVPELAPQAAA